MRTKVIALEMSGRDMTYSWEPVNASQDFSRMTVLPGRDVNDVPLVAYRQVLFARLGTSGADVVFVAGWSAPWALASLRWCRRNRVPAVLMSDSTAIDAPRSPWKEFIKRRIVGLFDAAFVAGSRHRDYVTQLGMPDEWVSQGYDVVDNSHFAIGADQARHDAISLRHKLDLPAHYFLASARFVEKKNLPGLLKAYARYRAATGESAWSLVILGDGPMRSELEQDIAALGLQDFVRMPGFQQYDQLPAYYGLAGAFVHASTVEQWGLVVNEAMAAGLSVLVSSNCGCAPDLVEEAGNGYTFDPYDMEGLAGLMGKLSSSDCDRLAMGQASRLIISRWSLATFTNGLMQTAETAIRTSGRRFGVVDRLLLWGLSRR